MGIYRTRGCGGESGGWGGDELIEASYDKLGPKGFLYKSCVGVCYLGTWRMSV